MNCSIADKSTPNQLHAERSKVLTPVDNDLGSLTFAVSADREGSGADLVVWEKRGTRTWGVPVYHLIRWEDAVGSAKVLNGMVRDGLLRPGPLLPTDDSVADVPSFTRGFGPYAGTGIVLAGGGKRNVWTVEGDCRLTHMEAKDLRDALNHLLASKTIRSGPMETTSRLQDANEVSVCMSRLALADENQGGIGPRIFVPSQKIFSILQAVTDASPMVDPNNQNPRRAPLDALDRAGVYGNDIEGLYQLCGSRPGRMVAVLRATTLGLIDAPAIKAALKPVGMLPVGGLDVDGIIKEVEGSVPEFSASRVAEPFHARINRVIETRALDHALEMDGIHLASFQADLSNYKTFEELPLNYQMAVQAGEEEVKSGWGSASELLPVPSVPTTPKSGARSDDGKGVLPDQTLR